MSFILSFEITRPRWTEAKLMLFTHKRSDSTKEGYTETLRNAFPGTHLRPRCTHITCSGAAHAECPCKAHAGPAPHLAGTRPFPGLGNSAFLAENGKSQKSHRRSSSLVRGPAPSQNFLQRDRRGRSFRKIIRPQHKEPHQKSLRQRAVSSHLSPSPFPSIPVPT